MCFDRRITQGGEGARAKIAFSKRVASQEYGTGNNREPDRKTRNTKSPRRGPGTKGGPLLTTKGFGKKRTPTHNIPTASLDGPSSRGRHPGMKVVGGGGGRRRRGSGGPPDLPSRKKVRERLNYGSRP